MRRSLGHDRPVDRFSPEQTYSEGQAQVRSKIHSLRNLQPPRSGPRHCEDAQLPLALSRGIAAGRSDEPVDDAGDGYLRKTAAQTTRSADAPRRALEVRLQEHQINRQDRV